MFLLGCSRQHDYIDLELPSGTLWATCNLGANNPAESGDLYSWGEVKSKKSYDCWNYRWSKGCQTDLTKYNTHGYYGHVVDDKIVLEPVDDAAYVNLGEAWRTPTSEEFQELLDNCTWKWTPCYDPKYSDVSGWIGTSKRNGKTIFFRKHVAGVGTKMMYYGI